MRPVTKDEFFTAVGPLDVHPHIVGGFPYTSRWETRSRQVVGLTVQRLEGGLTSTGYFLSDESR